MFFNRKELQFEAKPDKPDPIFAKQLQEVIGGQFGEMSVAMQYLFQGWNTRGNEKYKDLLMDTGTEELGHIEMLATMVAQLLEGAPVYEQEKAASDPVIGAIMGGMNPHHAIVSGLGATPENSAGVPWSGGYIIASGNLLADFRANVNAESQGRLQVARLYSLTDDKGVKDLLSFLLARDTMHQNQWIAAIRDLEEKEGGVITPSTVPPEWEATEYSHTLYNFSEGEDSASLPWMNGNAPDGHPFKYEQAQAFGQKPTLKPGPLESHDTLPEDKLKG
ncbi:manganese catalase family protein [Planococcus sp. CP5-4]|uniref:manganese catalase family protein n=1 Tax=unclassified Planococcus (in: firmicutes) TaxID=2662419 RepID=UPI001C22DBD2|nr:MULTISPECIES: manganese catalase family protein [unclassified Planococcus (in: firmicutes)]MBU9673184.1 manganese catalase family protein [Planococcus sp. CP5-4_YE]MBW6062492.1 manganese catalase family protein [Planococcus sp. CP5-4]MDN5709471.1 manganese catalase family protein [Planococcus sp. (in: firmicutes)]